MAPGAILWVTDVDEIPLGAGGLAAPGPAFVTRAIPGEKWGGQPEELRKLDNPQMLARLVVFDTWVLNEDRHPPAGSRRRPRPDNVFLTGEGAAKGKLRLIAMDFSEAFVTTAHDLGSNLADLGRVKDERLYGLFPEFGPYMRPEDLAAPTTRLRELDRPTLWSIVRDLPREWDVSPAAKDALVALLEERARFLADTIIDRLYMECWPDPLRLKYGGCDETD